MEEGPYTATLMSAEVGGRGGGHLFQGFPRQDRQIKTMLTDFPTFPCACKSVLFFVRRVACALCLSVRFISESVRGPPCGNLDACSEPSNSIRTVSPLSASSTCVSAQICWAYCVGKSEEFEYFGTQYGEEVGRKVRSLSTRSL